MGKPARAATRTTGFRTCATGLKLEADTDTIARIAILYESGSQEEQEHERNEGLLQGRSQPARRPRAETPGESAWAELREAQAMATTRLPKVGLAVAIDIGDAKDIHPRNKQDVGRRLGLAAEAITYGRQVSYSGPVYQSMRVANGTAELTFAHTDGGLKANGDALKGFAICGADKKFVWAEARIDGDKVLVSAAQVPEPVAVRYAWGDNPACNLVNGAELPAVPFRTDQP